MVISRALLDELVAHAREEYDAECCGMIAYAGRPDGLAGAAATRVHRARNIYASRKRFEIDGKELLHAIERVRVQRLGAGRDLPLPHPHRALPVPDRHQLRRQLAGVEWVIVGPRRRSAARSAVT